MAIVISSPSGLDSVSHRLVNSLESASPYEIGQTAINQQKILNTTQNNKDGSLLVVSPYDERPHLLDLETLDTANQLLARALVGMKCLREDYATAPYVDNFNWSEIVDSVHKLAELSDFKWAENSFYIVVFRSQIPPTTVYADLGVLDKAAHAEATESGGFLK